MSSETSTKGTIMSETITLAAGSSSVVTSALQLFSQFAIIGGGLWAVWGVITLAGGLKDQNGPATQSGVWQPCKTGGRAWSISSSASSTPSAPASATTSWPTC
jgi:hypothetical protein